MKLNGLLWFCTELTFCRNQLVLLAAVLLCFALTASGQNPGLGSTMLSVTPTTGAAGTLFTLSATVEKPGGAPLTDGAVNFYDGSKLLATVQIAKATGVATLATRGLTQGTLSLKAVFTGNASYRANTSNVVTVTVGSPYATGTVLTSAGAQGSYALTATIRSSGPGIPSGNVVFTDSSTSPVTTLGTVPLTARAEPAASYTLSPWTGPAGNQLVPGDFNGDGRQDLLVVGSGITFYPGNGDGTFEAGQSAGTAQYILAVGDFNEDGKLDLAVSSSGKLTILLGNGDGTFQTGQSYAGGFGGACADFNGDGKLDLADPNGNVLLGNGDGTFTALNSGAAPVGGYGIAGAIIAASSCTSTGGDVVADFNKDGKMDILAGADTGVQIFLGNGDGTFQTPIAIDNPYEEGAQGAAADFNLDGNPDVVLVDGDGHISVVLGNGDGTFRAPLMYGSGGYETSMAVGDLNGDGVPDIITTNEYHEETDAVSVLLGIGDGTFVQQQPYYGPSGFSVVTADLTGEGYSDIIFTTAPPDNYAPTSTNILLTGGASEVITETLTGVTLPGFGSDHVTATYSGDPAFTTSTSNTLTLPSQ